MQKRLVILGEGQGDHEALPVLAKRLITEHDGWDAIYLDENVIRLGHVCSLMRAGSYDTWIRRLQYALKRPNTGAALVVLDGDAKYFPPGTDQPFCAATVAAELASSAVVHLNAGDTFSLAVVFACQEYESWLVAGAESLAGRSLEDGRLALSANCLPPDGDLEVHHRDAKGWLKRQMAHGYSPTRDQAMLTRLVDLDAIRQRGMRSFRRLDSALIQLCDAVRTNCHLASPKVGS